MKFTVQEYYEMSDETFRSIYEDQAFKNILDFLETRIRLEILSIIRRFQLKGEVSFEVRQKSTTSAYSKLQSELVEKQADFGNRPVELFEVLRDLIGVRLICVHEEVQKRVFEYMLQVESIVIQSEGLEFYSAPFRDYTLAKDIHEELSDSIKGVQSSGDSRDEIKKKSKPSNYESLHFYVKFASKIDFHLLRRLTSGRRNSSEAERVRDRAEGEYLLGLHAKFSESQLKLISTIPIECQVRTITDHLWAQEEHKYVYKNASLPTDVSKNQQALEVLRGTFTGLKFAYYNVDRLRSLVRNVSASHDAHAPAYSDASEDLNPLRFAYYDSNIPLILGKFRAAEKAFVEVDKDLMNGKFDGRAMLDIIVDLYKSVSVLDVSENGPASTPFDTESWGRRRMFHLVLAYMALSATGKRLSSEAADLLKERVNLVDMIGEAALRTSMYDDEGLVKLASKIYERVETFDRLARTMTKEIDDLSDEKRDVFMDPLVGIRLASSFFIQEEFAGAFRALQEMFEIGDDDDLVSWSKLKLADDFSLAEILMRYSQYIVFDSFEDEDRMLESFFVLQRVFENVFEIESEEFYPKLYRCYAWYYSLINYLFTQKTLVPSGLTCFKAKANAYLIKYYNEAFESIVSGKPEVLMVSIYLQIHLADPETRQSRIDEAHSNFSNNLQQFSSYPRLAVSHLSRMAEKIKQRSLDKSGREHDSTFISYSQKDLGLVEKIVEYLTKNNVNVHYDKNFEKGLGITEQVEKAMLGASSAILVVTPMFFKSEWVAEERAFLMDKRRRKELKLFVLKIGVTDDDLNAKAPLLAGILAHNAETENLEEVVSTMASEIRSTYI